MWLRFTQRVRKIVLYAQEEAVAHGGTDVASEHLLLGLLRDVMAEEAEESVWPPAPTSQFNSADMAALILHEADVNLEQLWAEAQRQTELLHLPAGKEASKVQLTPSAKRVFDLMYEEGQRIAVKELTPEFLLLALIRDQKGSAGQTLVRSGVQLKVARQQVAALYWPVQPTLADKPKFWSRLFGK